ncbi:MerR family DNA-binding transcriptional regulator [Lactiplantibacillus pentosus]|jgi:DNA-binding transcriptional MerR regulator|nr:MerR family DNA-binding transcriptional regulator [Lactiplantibacillus pentosus]USJ87005.1 MerR family DNA-binding transcriptional regulator [Lactiplantibacillus pentosus]
MVASIKQVAQRFGITYDTLRFYERCGLLTDVARNKHGQRISSAEC